MNLPVAIFIGLRYTLARQRDQSVSFLSGISIVGLVVGVALLVAVLSVVNGFERELQEKILGLIPQAVIKNYEGIEDWKSLQRSLEADDEIIAAAPYVKKSALLNFGRLAEPIVVYGIDPSEEVRVSNIDDYLPADVLQTLDQGEAKIILGIDLAEKLGVNPGDKVMLVVPGEKKSNSAATVNYFKVVALIKTQTEIDSAIAVVGLAEALKFADHPSSVDGLRLKVKDIFSVNYIVYENLAKLGSGFAGDSWLRTHGNISYSIKVSKRLIGLVMSLIVAIAVFNVVSSLVMVVIDKRGDIAILRTLGASTKKIMSIFIVQGCVIGAIGTCIGILLGVGLALGIEDMVAGMEKLLGSQFLKSDVYPVTYLPAEIRFQDLLLVGLTAMTMSFLATLYPAWRASKVQPAEALRYE